MSTNEAKAEFLITKEYRRFAEFCDTCLRYRYIGLCFGAPGVGKTVSAREYAKWDEIEPSLDLFSDYEAPSTIASCNTIFYTPSVTCQPRELEHQIRCLRSSLNFAVGEVKQPKIKRTRELLPVRVGDRTKLMIVDEADRLKLQTLEELRDIFDRSKIGLILIGMPGLEKRLSRYAQLYSRVGFVHELKPLSSDEMRFLIERKWKQFGLDIQAEDFTDVEAMAAVIRITHGNLRLLQRLFSQIQRILEINEVKTITKEIVLAARESLVIGTT
jgi:hypothetical protein